MKFWDIDSDSKVGGHWDYQEEEKNAYFYFTIKAFGSDDGKTM